MVFSSMVFLFGFLPAVILLYYVLPRGFRNGWLFIASLFFYAWGEPVYIFIMLFSTVFDYCNGRLIGYFDAKGRHETASKAVMILSAAGNIGILSFFKYTDFAISTLNNLTGAGFSLLEIALPIGISFYTFQTMSYTIDVYRGLVKVQRNFLSFGMYVCLFPQLIAGPIVRYAEIADQIDERQHSFADCRDGLVRFLLGLSKKVLLANTAGAAFQELSTLAGGEHSAALAWLGALMYTFQIYFDFSGYSDMAIGLGRMLGFRFPENFNYPYEAKSITEFWRRWHMTLSGWFREYLYIPLGGSRRGTGRQIFNLLIVWALTGLWHGAAWNFVLWGLYYFVLLTFEKLFLQKAAVRLPAALGHIATMFFVVVGWVIFAFDDLGAMMGWLADMFHAKTIAGSAFFYEFSGYWLLLLVLAVGATSLPKKAWTALFSGGREKTGRVLLALISLALLALDVIFLVNDSYNPFLYFRF